MFIINNQAWFHLWWKENLVKYQKVSKYYVYGYLENFPLLYMFLLTVAIVKSSHILARILFIFLENILGVVCNRYIWHTSCLRLLNLSKRIPATPKNFYLYPTNIHMTPTHTKNIITLKKYTYKPENIFITPTHTKKIIILKSTPIKNAPNIHITPILTKNNF